MDNRVKRLLAWRYQELYSRFLAFQGESYIIKSVICSSDYAFILSINIRDLASPASITPKMEVAGFNRQNAQNFIKTYHTIYGRDPSNVEINNHLARGTQHEGVNWIRAFESFQADEIPIRGAELVEEDDTNKYRWVDSDILGTHSLLNDHVIMHLSNIEVGHPSN